MVPLARRMIIESKSKILITILGVGFIITLIFFLVGIFEGVKVGATGYVVNSQTDLWVCQKNSTNLLRSSSFMSSSVGQKINSINGVETVEGILRVLVTAEIKNQKVTLFNFGFRSGSSLGEPKVISGTSRIKSGEIIVDESFAKKYKLTFADSFSVQNNIFHVAGLSTQTNATLAQFSFTKVEDAQKLIGFPNVFSFYLIKISKKASLAKTLKRLRNNFPTLSVFTKEEFIQNNLDELYTGVLPILFTIAILGLVTGGIIITLMQYSSVLEQREDYALLKALGMKHPQILSLIWRQSLAISILGFFTGVIFYIILTPILSELVPELIMMLSPTTLLLILIISVSIGTLSSISSIYKVSRIYPAEVFRA